MNELLQLKKNGIVHGDIKPSNMCFKQIGPNFRICLIDFGFAKYCKTASSKALGTPGYVAPEVILFHKNRVIDYALDVYTLAGVLGEVFGATNVMSFKKKHRAIANICLQKYSFEGMFDSYDVSFIDPHLLNDLKMLLNQMHLYLASKRPTIEVIAKFFALYQQRNKAYDSFINEWQQFYKLLETKFAPHAQLERLGLVIKELVFRPKSYLSLCQELIKDNRLVDFEREDRPYPSMEPIVEYLQSIESTVLTVPITRKLINKAPSGGQSYNFFSENNSINDNHVGVQNTQTFFVKESRHAIASSKQISQRHEL